MKIKIASVLNQGSMVQVLGHDKDGGFQSVPFDWRMFRMMWEQLEDGQKNGKEFVEINW